VVPLVASPHSPGVLAIFVWCWVYGFIESSTGESEGWIFNRVNTEIMNRILAAFAQAMGIDAQHPALLVLDQARWHTTKKLEELEEAISRRCRQLIKQPQMLQAFTQFHWWPRSLTCIV